MMRAFQTDKPRRVSFERRLLSGLPVIRPESMASAEITSYKRTYGPEQFSGLLGIHFSMSVIARLRQLNSPAKIISADRPVAFQAGRHP